jgi:hypothetical protein
VIYLAEVTQWSTTAALIAGGRGSFASGDGRAGHQPGRLFRANNGLVQRDMIGPSCLLLVVGRDPILPLTHVLLLQKPQTGWAKP